MPNCAGSGIGERNTVRHDTIASVARFTVYDANEPLCSHHRCSPESSSAARSVVDTDVRLDDSLRQRA